jgi:nucleotide-binding universal stress UspA family protein
MAESTFIYAEKKPAMSQNSLFPEYKIGSIFHPSDFSASSEIAFVHALKIALTSKALLNMLHVATDSNEDVDWHDFPGVRETLERWKLIAPGSPKQAVVDLGIDVCKVVAEGKEKNPVKACLEYLEINSADLIVLAVHRHEGFMRWIGKSVGEPIARGSKEMTLFIPEGVKGFVSWEDGSVNLKNILIPVASKPSPKPALEAARRLIGNLKLPAGTVTLLSVSPTGEMPPLDLPADTGWTWNQKVVEGEPVEEILKTAEDINADLIIMTTDGPDGFLDGLRGTTSERVLWKAKCPIANLPVGSMLG